MGRLTERKGEYCFMSCGDAKEKYGDACPFHNNCYERKIHDKLAHYEDLEEAGRLIELPCAVGDTVWEIASVYYFDDREPTHSIHRTTFTLAELSGIGDWVFLTKEEAEAKLKELEGVKK